jgi:hypothetical protein
LWQNKWYNSNGDEDEKEIKMEIKFPHLSEDLSRVKLPARVERKYDGELNIWDGICLTNRYGTQRYLPFCAHLPKDIKLIGELYYKDGRSNFYEALPHLKNNSPNLKYMIFGIWESDLPYIQQIQSLRFLPNVSDGMTAYSYKEVEYYAKQYVKEGYEGAVIKPIMCKTPESWIKYKPDKSLDLLILALRKDKFSVAVGLDGQILGHCTLNGFKDLVKQLETLEITREDKEHYYFKPEIIVEVEHLGIIRNEGVHLRHPRIKRVREDLRKEDLCLDLLF